MAGAVIVLVLVLALAAPALKAPPRHGGGGLLLLVLAAAALAARGGAGGAPPATCDVAGIAGLSAATAAAVCELDAAIGGGLTIVSGHRSRADQARVCATTALPCAPPGRSLHQAGAAVDLASAQVPAVLAALAADPSIPLCHSFPAADPVHFSLRGAGEC